MKFSSLAVISLFARTTLALVGTWTVLDVKLPESISDLTANLGPDGLIYVAGGCNASEGNVYNNDTGFFDCLSITDSFVSFNPTTNKVVTLPSLPRPRYRHGAAVSNNRLWLIGGRTVATDVIMEIDVSGCVYMSFLSLPDIWFQMMSQNPKPVNPWVVEYFISRVSPVCMFARRWFRCIGL